MERLTKSLDIKRVKNEGKTYLHPLVVMVALPNNFSTIRYCVSAGRHIGKAVKRNRAKRVIKAALSQIHRIYNESNFPSGWDVLFIAKTPITKVKSCQVIPVLENLLSQANILHKHDEKQR